MLGLTWTREDLLSQVSPSKEPAGPPNKVMFPLSLLLRPEIWQTLKKVFDLESSGEGNVGMPHVPDGVISMSMLSKDEFIKKMGMNGQQQVTDPTLMTMNKPKAASGLSTGPARRLGGK